MAAGRTVATPLLFRESLYSDYFQPAGDRSRFMRQPSRLVGWIARPCWLDTPWEPKGLRGRKKEEETGGKIIGGKVKLFQYFTPATLSPGERETRATFPRKSVESGANGRHAERRRGEGTLKSMRNWWARCGERENERE